MKNVISDEVAGETIDKFKEYYDIDIDDFPGDVKAALVASFRKMKRSIMEGRLEIEIAEETIAVRQHLEKPPEGAENPLVYKELSGSSKVNLTDDVGSHKKMYYFLGVLSGEGLKVIQALKGKDMSLAEALGCVFLQV